MELFSCGGYFMAAKNYKYDPSVKGYLIYGERILIIGIEKKSNIVETIEVLTYG